MPSQLEVNGYVERKALTLKNDVIRFSYYIKLESIVDRKLVCENQLLFLISQSYRISNYRCFSFFYYLMFVHSMFFGFLKAN